MATNDTSTLIDFRLSPEYQGRTVLVLNGCLIATTTIIVGLRFYVRIFMSKVPGIDDLLAGFAFVILCTQSALDIRSVGYGSGAHIQYVPYPLLVKWFASLINNEFLYMIGTGLMRLSIVAFLPRLAKDLSSPMFVKAVYGVGVVTILQTVICLCYRLFGCRPISATWLVPDPTLNCITAEQDQANFIAHQAVALAIDIALFALPIWVIHSKMIWSKRKAQVLLVFSVGSFVVATGIVRMVYLNTLSFLADPTYAMTTIGFWTDMEGHIGLWCGSFPALQPLLRQISFKLGIRSKLRSYGNSTDGPKSKSGTHKMGSGNHAWTDSNVRKGGYAKNGSGVDAETDDGSERGIVAGADKGDVELYDLGANSPTHHIHKRVDYDVTVEERTAERGARRADGKTTPNEGWVDM